MEYHQVNTRIELELTPKEIDQLREVMDAQPLRPYAPLIVKVLKALPLESAAAHVSADSSRPAPALPVETGCGYLSPDAGCIECTCGTVPGKYNTGLCAYHVAKQLLGQS